jgi:GTP cyclohydrolase I
MQTKPALETFDPTAQDLERAISMLLQGFDDDPYREGLVDTPKRYRKLMQELCTRKPIEFTTFEDEQYDEMISVSEIPFYSLCEHHLVPFFGVAHVSYIPNGRIVGLSKIPRLVEYCSAGFQNQERITQEIARMLDEKLTPRGVGVQVKARHLCMEMRGVKKPGAMTTTTSLIGLFKSDKQVREEFLDSIRK